MDILEEPSPPQSIGLLTNADILLGSPIAPIDRLKIVSSEQYEDIVREWIAGYCTSKYRKVRRSGGAGDKGRDVIAYASDTEWHNFQCKHYNHSLYPGDVWSEIGKLCYYTFLGDYTLPTLYTFVAPLGVGSTLGDYLDDPDKLKEKLFEEWDDKCASHITSKATIPMDALLKAHIDTIDFKIFNALDPQEFIEQHKQTNYFAARFGGGLIKRPIPTIPAVGADTKDVRYVEQLFQAYGDLEAKKFNILDELKSHTVLYEHFNRQRECFYWAEALEKFSRDALPIGDNSFNELKDEIYHGVIDACNISYANSFERVQKTISCANALSIQGSALQSAFKIQDRIGLCHHLANENKLIWVK